MLWRKNRNQRRHTFPLGDFINQSGVPQKHKLSLGKYSWTYKQGVLFLLAFSLTFSGVVASVAITLRGNSSTQDNVVSLGVGQAQAVSCNYSTTIKTDTISSWDDTLGDFALQQVDVSGVQSSCQNQAMTLVINMSSGPDLNITCTLPASASWTYAQSTFVFASTSFSNTGLRYGCPNFTYPLYMASISAAAVQIK